MAGHSVTEDTKMSEPAFLQRHGLTTAKPVQATDMDTALATRLWNAWYSYKSELATFDSGREFLAGLRWHIWLDFLVGLRPHKGNNLYKFVTHQWA